MEGQGNQHCRSGTGWVEVCCCPFGLCWCAFLWVHIRPALPGVCPIDRGPERPNRCLTGSCRRL